MKTSRTITRKPAQEAERKIQVSGASIESAMRCARIPNRYVKQAVSLSAFLWGDKMKAWIDKVLLAPDAKGKSFYVATDEHDSMDASAMLARTLVLRGFDAVWCSLDELLHDDGEILRRPDFLIVAGFYSKEFDTKKGCPMTPAQAHSLSWKLWRASADGVAIVACVSPHEADAESWWTNGALAGIFDRTQTLRSKKKSI